jgi:hypothetical protein
MKRPLSQTAPPSFRQPRANALVVVNLTCAGLRARSGKGLATLRTANWFPTLHWARWYADAIVSVLLQQLLSTDEALFLHQGWYGNLDPLSPGPSLACRGAGRSDTPPTLWAHNPCPCTDAGFAEAGVAAIGGVPLARPPSVPSGWLYESGHVPC